MATAVTAMAALEKVSLDDQNSGERKFEQIIGNSRGLESVLQKGELVSPTDSTVLIQGKPAPARNSSLERCTSSALGRDGLSSN